MNAELEDAAAVGFDLIRHVHALLPITIGADDASDPAVQLQWIPVRVTDTLQSVLLLGQSGLHEDAAALVRVMADHLIAFAWLLADKNPPDRINAWKNDDLRLADALRDHLAELNVELEPIPEGPDRLPGESPPRVETGVRWVRAETAARECDEFGVPT